MVIDFRASMSNNALHDTAMIQPLDYSRDCIMQSRTILDLRLIPDKGSSNALPLFIAMRGISNNFVVYLPSWHDEIRVC